VPPGTSLTRVNGDLVITTAGTTYDALDIHGFVVVKAPDVTITRSIIRGGQATTSLGLISVRPTATRFVIEDSELVPEHPSKFLSGILGANFTASRVDVHGTVDGIGVLGGNVWVVQSWLHGFRDFPSDPYQGGGPSHNDGVQVQGGYHIWIVGNTITGASNAAVQVTQDVGVTTDLHILQNWVDGGGCTVNLHHKDLASMGGITLSGNRFGRHSRYPGCALIASRATVVMAAGNVWDDNGLPVHLGRGS
jgi:hypothetical protein